MKIVHTTALLVLILPCLCVCQARYNDDRACNILSKFTVGAEDDFITALTNKSCGLHVLNSVLTYGSVIEVQVTCKSSSPAAPQYVVFEAFRPNSTCSPYQRYPRGSFTSANKTIPVIECRERYLQRLDEKTSNGRLATVFWHAPRCRQENTWIKAVSLRATLYDTNYRPVTYLSKVVKLNKGLKRVPRGDYDNFRPIAVDSCGVTKNCFRYGKSKCTSDTCVYLLTYRSQGDEVYFEMDAKSTGWAAVGFSSDKYMGGDDVYACVTVNTESNTVVVKRYTNVIHWSIEQSFNPVNNTEGRVKDGRISCRFSRKKKVDQDDTVTDLDNRWYFLYAWGPATSGTILAHSVKRPPHSKIKIAANTINLRDDFSGSVSIHKVWLLLTVSLAWMATWPIS
ncbi:uncharacterized protein [Ptychodera flava]|uniref:uncharacterized protein n=1 Tax=Ptychodera flava TaxID=63121 RepID=UPI00396A2BE4